jgi:hypothetical protein
MSAKDFWIIGPYYVDFDEYNQFRIIGPNNHLFLGLVDIPRHKIRIKNLKLKNSHLIVEGTFQTRILNLYYPAMDDMRTVRELISKEEGYQVTFLDLRTKYFDRLVPTVVRSILKDKKILIFRRHYEEHLYYQTSFEFPPSVNIKKISKPYKGFQLETKKEGIDFILQAKTNDLHPKRFKRFFLYEKEDFNLEIFGKFREIVERFWEETGSQIEHLITWGKTSGDRFGTIFPRDWMEGADLGLHDLQEEVRSYMYEASLKNVNQKGEGWHEDVVGEYRYEHEIAGRDIFDRHMIDIEPHYLMGLEKLPEAFLAQRKNREKLRRVARYLTEKARKNDLITFAKLPPQEQTKEEKYWTSGNWRDSPWAYKKISPLIAPFDVNAVFYPEALKSLRRFQDRLGLRIKDLNYLIKKWENKKKEYVFKEKDGLLAYALALYGEERKGKIEFKKMKVSHLDEAYLYTYSKATPKEIKSFCQRLLEPKYFYTPSGPLIIARNNQYGYTSQEYHGLVIWPKQTAFVILGLSKHLKLAITCQWPRSLQKLIKKTILSISKNTIEAFNHLGAVPELYFDNKGVACFFHSQPEVKGRMSKVQLWSAIGARRIFRKYYELLSEEIYKDI